MTIWSVLKLPKIAWPAPLTYVNNCHDHWIMSSYLSAQFKYMIFHIFISAIFRLWHLRFTGASSEATSVGALSTLATTWMGNLAHRSFISSFRSPRALSLRVPTTLNFSSGRFCFIVNPASLLCWEIIKERWPSYIGVETVSAVWLRPERLRRRLI